MHGTREIAVGGRFLAQSGCGCRYHSRIKRVAQGPGEVGPGDGYEEAMKGEKCKGPRDDGSRLTLPGGMS